MPFNEHIREYREQLDITQIEAADRLGIDHSALSKYELGKLEIPIQLLPKLRSVYAIPRDMFMDMLEDTRQKSSNPGLEARENKSRYITAFQNVLKLELYDSKEFRNLLSRLNSLEKKDAESLLQKIKKIDDI
ncbi:helix-turn-helix domain-containing protein [Psychrobacillus sp. L4]|uniref:helix-turn-helix domain-containing protein n=1 Tax=Psychrobacillus sp. L4 TaxID=3236892 RepID=UPI0036F3E78A